MTIESGVRLGPYEIVAPLGAGGMGEVYRARDTRLERSVAIKILPAEFAQNAQLKLRFEREAKSISQLNHPHICTLYDVGSDNGTDYLVMELLEGESLAERLTRGALPVEQVLEYGIQIADALDRAHKQGVVHRDLKPGNVMITKGGAKLLDFGLAKSAIVQVSPDGATVHRALTQEGTIVGTFQYMSPEQLESQDVDHRADIFAFGALLYEMASGRRAFEGKTKTSLIAAIVSSQPPPISQLQPLTPPAFEHVVQRCLEKDPNDRWQSAHDVAEELKWIRAKGSQAGVAAPLAALRRKREKAAWLLHLVTLVAGAALTWGAIEWRREPPRVVTTAVLPPEKALFTFEVGAPVLSPDGRRIAFLAERDGKRMLWVRTLSGTGAQPLTGTEDANRPFWSPDGRYLAFFSGGKLRKIDAAGGPPQALCDVAGARGGSWSKEGMIVFAPSLNSALMKISEAGGVPAPVTRIDQGARETSHRMPSFLPDGRRFVYVALQPGAGAGHEIIVGSIDGTLRQSLLRADSNPVYAAPGYLLYWRDGSIVAQRFDAGKLRLDPQVLPLAEGVDRNPAMEAIFSVSTEGALAYSGGASLGLSQLAWFGLDGKELGAFPKTADFSTPSVSHDGRKIAVQAVESASTFGDIWILDLARATSTRLTFEPSNEYGALWSPDDSRVVYTSNRSSGGDIYMRRSSGTGAEELLYANPAWTIATDWSRDGKWLALQELNSKGNSDWDIWLYSFEERKARPFLQTPFSETLPRFSPDGRWIAYQSTESGKSQVYVQPVSGEGGKWQISVDGGTRPRWRGDGKQIFFVAPDWKLMVADVRAAGDAFEAGLPRVALAAPMERDSGPQYDIAPDGKRFLVNRPIEQRETPPITLVQNWTEKLRR